MDAARSRLIVRTICAGPRYASTLHAVPLYLPTPLHTRIVAEPGWEPRTVGWLRKSLDFPQEYGIDTLALATRQSTEVPPEVAAAMFGRKRQLDQRFVRAVFDWILDDKVLLEKVLLRSYAMEFGATDAVRVGAHLRLDQAHVAGAVGAPSMRHVLAAGLVETYQRNLFSLIRRKSGAVRALELPAYWDQQFTDVMRRMGADPSLAFTRVATSEQQRISRGPADPEARPAVLALPPDLADRLATETRFPGTYIARTVARLAERRRLLDPSGAEREGPGRSSRRYLLNAQTLTDLDSFVEAVGSQRWQAIEKALEVYEDDAGATPREVDAEIQVSLPVNVHGGLREQYGSAVRASPHVDAAVVAFLARPDRVDLLQLPAKVDVPFRAPAGFWSVVPAIAEAADLSRSQTVIAELATQLRHAPTGPDVRRPMVDLDIEGNNAVLRGLAREWRNQGAAVERGMAVLTASTVVDVAALETFRQADDQRRINVPLDAAAVADFRLWCADHGVPFRTALLAATALGIGVDELPGVVLPSPQAELEGGDVDRVGALDDPPLAVAEARLDPLSDAHSTAPVDHDPPIGGMPAPSQDPSSIRGPRSGELGHGI